MTERRSVWVVERGEYSDYRVIGVFSSRANAESVAKAANAGGGGWSEATVDEWPLDPAIEALQQGYHQHDVLMLRDGTVERIKRHEEIDSSDLAGDGGYLWERSKAPAYKGTNTPDVLAVTVWAKDDEHAVKIVNERRTRMIADGKWL